MSELKKFKLHICIIIYFIMISFIILLKPDFCYDNNKNLKQFGIGSKKTIFPLWLLIIFVALISYYISNLIVIFK